MLKRFSILLPLITLPAFAYLLKSQPDLKNKISPLIQLGKLQMEKAYANYQDVNVYEQVYPKTVLTDMWTSYKAVFVQSDGRTIDRNADLVTTSEGQSYTMLRAVWVDDRATFDKAWTWTNVNLKKRTTDKLFAWKWGQKSDGTWGILTDQNGMNTASDADQDLALALILAYYRWNDQYYLDQAKNTLSDIWKTDITVINGQPYLMAGNWGDSGSTVTVNPSYYSFAAYPLFAKTDPSHDWLSLKDTSYYVLNKFDGQLPPDWAQITKKDLSVKPIALNGKQVSFAQDASRVLWRVALDLQQNGDQRAAQYLSALKIPQAIWSGSGIINDSYQLNGQPITNTESISMYATLLPYFQFLNNTEAGQISGQKIIADFNPDTGDFRYPIGYYDANWAWFGLALYNNLLFFPRTGGTTQ